jgi:predicted transcriptional regulator
MDGKVTARLKPETREAVREIAAERDWTDSHLARRAIEQYVAEQAAAQPDREVK